jgi:hypothetical protein
VAGEEEGGGWELDRASRRVCGWNLGRLDVDLEETERHRRRSRDLVRETSGRWIRRWTGGVVGVCLTPARWVAASTCFFTRERNRGIESADSDGAPLRSCVKIYTDV